MQIGAGPVVGLDIGTSAVRAAQVAHGRDGPSLVRFGQVALPPGAVIDGEIADPGVVSEAIARLFKRARIRSRKVAVGIANQRVVVRQVDLPYLDDKEFRSSLRFQVADYIPMSVDEAEIDYQVLSDYEGEDGRMMKVLLVAAATDMVESFVEVVTAAGLDPVAVDLTPFAVARAVSPVARGEQGLDGAEAIIDVGAGVTNILVHLNGEPRFVRILLLGGDEVTGAVAEELGCDFEEAEAAKLDHSAGWGSEAIGRVITRQVEEWVAEVRGSVDYYLGQDDAVPVTSVVLTGGGSLTAGLRDALASSLELPVRFGDVLSDLSARRPPLPEEHLALAEPVAAAPVGLALGGAR